MRGPLALSIVLLVAVPCLAETPALTFRGGLLSLGRLPPVLEDALVARQLETGLTTVFLFTVEVRGATAQKGAAQVGIRYDLWDEVYRVERLEGRGERTTVSVRSRASLGEWWRSLTLQVAPAGVAWQPTPTQGKVVLQVLPFSQAEQRDAQDWLLRSFRGTTPVPRSDRGGAAPAPATPVREFYGAMLASSIGRRSLIAYSWTVPVSVESR